jgi:molybdopterin-guanine dinucleotide biosynthesis protein A
MPSSVVVGVVLAGGRSRRMGQNKAFVPLNGKPLIAHVIERLEKQVSRLAINSNDDPAPFRAWNLPVLADVHTGFQGPLAGIHAALSFFPDTPVLTVAVDLPFLPHDLVARLLYGWNGQTTRFAEQNGWLSAIALWPAGSAPRVESFLVGGQSSLHAWREQYGEGVEFAVRALDDVGFNVNTPEDLAKAEERLATGNPD